MTILGSSLELASPANRFAVPTHSPNTSRRRTVSGCCNAGEMNDGGRPVQTQRLNDSAEIAKINVQIAVVAAAVTENDDLVPILT